MLGFRLSSLLLMLHVYSHVDVSLASDIYHAAVKVTDLFHLFSVPWEGYFTVYLLSTMVTVYATNCAF